jgi:kynurenine formamidase
VSPEFPLYAELPELADTGERHAWGVFGAADELGTLNFRSPADVVAAAAEIASGRVVCLSIPLDRPNPPLGARKPFGHTVLRQRSGRDDRLTDFYLQCSSQWDGLPHIRFREFGYYNGREEDDLDRGELGIDRIATHGIVGRGVLVDVARHRADQGNPIDPQARVPLDVALLEQTLDAQGTELRPGTTLLVRTGWSQWYRSLETDGRAALAGRLVNADGGLEAPGLDPSAATAEWLWDNRICAVAADNPSLEALRVRREEGFLHRRLIPLLGMPIGEFWELDELSDACAEAGRWSFFLTSAPLRLPRGVGSPNNAYAVL